jgi:hypothetical protein
MSTGSPSGVVTHTEPASSHVASRTTAWPPSPSGCSPAEAREGGSERGGEGRGREGGREGGMEGVRERTTCICKMYLQHEFATRICKSDGVRGKKKFQNLVLWGSWSRARSIFLFHWDLLFARSE